jgi:hypothetical protein
MWRRYLIGNIEFAVIVFRQCFRRSFLAVFFSLLEKNSFAAELHEPGLQYKRRLIESLTHFTPGETSESHDSSTLAA